MVSAPANTRTIRQTILDFLRGNGSTRWRRWVLRGAVAGSGPLGLYWLLSASVWVDGYAHRVAGDVPWPAAPYRIGYTALELRVWAWEIQGIAAVGLFFGGSTVWLARAATRWARSRPPKSK